jgi:hypothetical protein
MSLNIWEYQKEQMRKHIAKDSANFYTYSKEHLSLAFPVVNVDQVQKAEKEENEAKWKTKKGFDNLGKKTNWNEHPKKLPQSAVDELNIPFHE